jgi:hypothetical protein
VHCLCNTEVGDLRTTFSIDQDVARRDVAMDDAAHMCSGKSTSDLRGNGCCTTRDKRTHSSQHGGQVLAVDELHDDGWGFAIRRNVEDGGNIRVCDDCGGASLGAESISGGTRCCERRAQHLYGYVAAERLIGCAKDECSGPFTDQLL